ncbi:unnamed protein product [Ectocarpus sp. 12 AP-2014]
MQRAPASGGQAGLVAEVEPTAAEAPGAAKTFAAQLVDQSMLQPVGDDFRVHDLVLRFLKPKLKADPNRSIATSRTAEYMEQPEVLRRCVNAGETSGGIYALRKLSSSLSSRIHLN